MNEKIQILLLGSTGQLGSFLAAQLCHHENVALRVTSRKQNQLAELARRNGDAVFLDLDDPSTFHDAFQNIQRLFLLTTYSFSMVVQSKIVVDYAVQAGVEHIVHLGVYSRDKNCTVPHFAWHQMIEAYIKMSGLKWTFLHPNCFLQNLTNFSLIKEGKLRWYALDIPCGWIALEDVAAAAAKILIEGPSKHHAKDYWFSTESMSISKVAEILTAVTGKSIVADPRSSDQFLSDIKNGKKPLDPYFYSVAESFRQLENGMTPFISEVKDDLPLLLGHKGTSVREWAERHKEEFLRLVSNTENVMTWGNKN